MMNRSFMCKQKKSDERIASERMARVAIWRLAR